MQIYKAFGIQLSQRTRQDHFTTVLTVQRVLSLLFVALMLNISPAHAHRKGIYESQSDAQKRAAEIGCSTVHQNNGRWMPCANEQELHRQLRKH